MLGLRYFRCRRCDRVYSDVEMPPWCLACDAERFQEVTPGLDDATYFSPR